MEDEDHDASADPPESERSVIQRTAAAVSSEDGGGFGHEGGGSNRQSDVTSEFRWPHVRHVVPVMKRRVFSGEVPLRPARPHVTGKGLAGSAFRAVPDRHGEGVIGVKRPAPKEFDRQSRWGRSGRPRMGLSASLPSNSAPPGRKGSTTSIPPPSEGSPGVGPRRTRGGETNARGGGVCGKPPPQNTRDSTITSTNPAALRFRLRDFTPQRRPRSSFGGSSLQGGGSVAMVAWRKPLTNDDAVSGVGDSKERGVQGSRRRWAGRSGPKSRYILGAELPGSEGVDVATAPRKTVEVGASTRAKAEVVSILLSVIHQGAKDTSDVTEQVRQEASVRAVRQHQADKQGQAQLQTQVGDVTSAQGDKESSAEFGFPGRTTGRRATAIATSFARPKAITFVRTVPAKRSRASRDQNADVEAPVPADEDSLGVFEFGSGQPPSSRLMRRSPRKLINSLESYAVPPMEPLEVLGSSAGDSHELRGAAGDSRSRGDSSVVPSPAPAAKGFDMSLFRKPGEWKCGTCLVKNPPGGDKCVSCETPKHGGVQAGGAPAASDSRSSGFFAGSIVGGALFASSAPTIPSFTFGVQAGVVSGGGSFGEAQKNGASTGASPTTTKGFDMSLFVKPGEWKCDACLVRNAQDVDKCASCETPRSASASPAARASGSFGEAQKNGASTGASPTTTKGFDMSLFVKPGEWKCDACLVRNAQDNDKCASCETSKSASASPATRASGSFGGGVAGNSSSPTQAFIFGAPTGTTYTGHTAAPTPPVSATTFDVGFGYSPGAPLSDTLASGRISDSRGARAFSPSNPDPA